MMAHQYRGDENQDFGYNRANSYGIPQTSYSPYPNQLPTPYSQAPLDHSGTMSSQYSSSPSLYGHSSQHPFPASGYHHSQPYSLSKYPPSPRYLPAQERVDIESQDAEDPHSMLSEPVVPAPEGFPDISRFDALMENYVKDLSIKKQDKALIHARRAKNIRSVLLDPKDTTVESAQFRFWAKKMFKLGPSVGRTPDDKIQIWHEGKPVAIREKLFRILTKAHQQCQHGGRDKTSAQVRRIYSWVPKELISRYVKICPTCQVRRGGRISPPGSFQSPPSYDTVSPPQPPLLSPPDSRRESVVSRSSIGALSRPEQPHTYGYSWNNSHHNGHHQYQNVPPVSSANGWGTHPRAIPGNVEGGVGNGMSMPSHHFDYPSPYDEPHLPGPHHY